MSHPAKRGPVPRRRGLPWRPASPRPGWEGGSLAHRPRLAGRTGMDGKGVLGNPGGGGYQASPAERLPVWQVGRGGSVTLQKGWLASWLACGRGSSSRRAPAVAPGVWVGPAAAPSRGGDGGPAPYGGVDRPLPGGKSQFTPPSAPSPPQK